MFCHDFDAQGSVKMRYNVEYRLRQRTYKRLRERSHPPPNAYTVSAMFRRVIRPILLFRKGMGSRRMHQGYSHGNTR